MKKLMLTLLGSLFYLQAQATPLERSLHDMINKVDPSINMSMSVVDLNTGRTIFQRNADRILIPASNMKLFSEAATLMALGPDYRFQRQLSTDAAILDNGTLNGSLYLTLPGDPSFTSQDLNALLSSLTSWGIKRIIGNVVLVNKNAGVDPYPPGRDPRDKTHSYGSPIAPIIIDENRLILVVNPGGRVNDPAFIDVSAPKDVISINNTVKTSEKPTLSAIGYRLDADNHLTASGAIGNATWAMENKIAILNPLLYAQDLVKSQLKILGVELNGTVVEGSLPVTTLVLDTQISEPLHQLMADTLKPSDNVFADSLFINTASIINGASVNWAEANNVMKQFLQQQTGINLTNSVLIDGSGLSKHDRISAEQTVGLLKYIYNHFPIAYEFIAALPISGHDGTLLRRFNSASQQGLIRAKTGTMTGILSLSGYLSAANGHTLAFAIYINRNPKTPPNVAGRYRSLIDQLCGFLLQQKPGGINSFVLHNPNGRVAFQQTPSQANKQRTIQAQWRGLEMSLRKALQGNLVAVVYKSNELVIKDNNPEINNVANVLINLSKKYPLSIAVQSPDIPKAGSPALRMLWIKTANSNSGTARTWILRRGLS